jgi:hypothetical protein
VPVTITQTIANSLVGTLAETPRIDAEFTPEAPRLAAAGA